MIHVAQDEFLSFIRRNVFLQDVIIKGNDCVKSVQIRSYFWSMIPCIRTDTGKYGPETITPYLDTFHAVNAIS